MSATTVKLLRAASEIVGGDESLAKHLGVGEKLFESFATDLAQLPDVLLLRAVDIILADRALQLATARREKSGHE